MISIISLIVIIAIVGLILWLVETYLPLDAGVKRFLQIAVIIILVIWLLQALGLWGSIGGASI